VAWTNALNVAGNDIEREGVYIHLARVKLSAGRFDEARAQLAAVTNSFYVEMKNRITRNLAEREKAATNSIAAVADAVTSTNSLAEPK
jgi:predicted negative regulator of RcsB-dependent stress response